MFTIYLRPRARTETVKATRSSEWVMEKDSRLVWLVILASLLVIVLAAVESGRLAGLKSFGEGIVPSVVRSNATEIIGRASGTATQTVVGGSDRTGGAGVVQLASGGFTFTLAGWYIYVVLAAALVLAFTLLIRSGRKGGEVYDFAGALAEIVEERSRLKGSWSSRLRNATLLRYYSLMRRVCTRVGIKEVPAETPREYIGRVTKELNMDPKESEKFTEVFNRARYGLELSEKEVEEASGFMGGFVDIIRRRTENG